MNSSSQCCRRGEKGEDWQLITGTATWRPLLTAFGGVMKTGASLEWFQGKGEGKSLKAKNLHNFSRNSLNRWRQRRSRWKGVASREWFSSSNGRNNILRGKCWWQVDGKDTAEREKLMRRREREARVEDRLSRQRRQTRGCCAQVEESAFPRIPYGLYMWTRRRQNLCR